MAIRVANYPLALGDRLYSRRAAAWGTIVQILDNAAVMSVTKGETTRLYTLTEGGLVAGSRDVYWHAPIALDLPKDQMYKLQKIQTLVAAIEEVL